MAVGAKMERGGQSAIREQNKRVKVMPRVVGKHKVIWNGDYGGVEGKGGVNGGVGGGVTGPTGGLRESIGIGRISILMSEV